MSHTNMGVTIAAGVTLSLLSAYSPVHALTSAHGFNQHEVNTINSILNKQKWTKATSKTVQTTSSSRKPTARKKNINSWQARYLINAAQQILPTSLGQTKPVKSASHTNQIVQIKSRQSYPPPYRQVNHKSNQKQAHSSTWHQIYNGFRFKNFNHKARVRKAIRASSHPRRLELLAERSTTYLPMIVAEVKRRGIPTEIAMLPFVESGFKTTAYSHASAAGLWQFIPATGRRYGLKQGRNYDGRYDPIGATHAALDYLTDLHGQFGDWLLALAAYNCGENRVANEIAYNRSRGKPTDYWHLSLPRETRNYVPKLLAYKEAFRNPNVFGFRLPHLPAANNLMELTVNKRVDLREVAEKTNLPVDTLISLNRGYKTGITLPKYSKRVIVPKQHARRIYHTIVNMPATKSKGMYTARYPKKSSFRYTASSHYLDRFAKMFGITKSSTTPYKARYSTNNTKSHRVKSGETLFRIAQQYGTSVQKIMRLNRLSSTTIRVGEKIRIT